MLINLDGDEEIELGDNGFVVNEGLIRVDPSFRCISILLNHYSFIIIPIGSKGLETHFQVYKSDLGFSGEVKDYTFLHNSVFPTFLVLCVLIFLSIITYRKVHQPGQVQALITAVIPVYIPLLSLSHSIKLTPPLSITVYLMIAFPFIPSLPPITVISFSLPTFSSISSPMNHIFLFSMPMENNISKNEPFAIQIPVMPSPSYNKTIPKSYLNAFYLMLFLSKPHNPIYFIFFHPKKNSLVFKFNIITIKFDLFPFPRFIDFSRNQWNWIQFCF